MPGQRSPNDPATEDMEGFLHDMPVDENVKAVFRVCPCRVQGQVMEKCPELADDPTSAMLYYIKLPSNTPPSP